MGWNMEASKYEKLSLTSISENIVRSCGNFKLWIALRCCLAKCRLARVIDYSLLKCVISVVQRRNYRLERINQVVGDINFTSITFIL